MEVFTGETTLFQYPVEHLGLPVQVIIELFVKIALEQAQLVAQRDMLATQESRSGRQIVRGHRCQTCLPILLQAPCPTIR